jgi:yopX protein
MSGDILKFSEVDTAIVIWNEKYAYFMVKPIQEYYFDSDVLGQALEYNDNVEKIGNIYDNPELLGGE